MMDMDMPMFNTPGKVLEGNLNKKTNQHKVTRRNSVTMLMKNFRKKMNYCERKKIGAPKNQE